MTLAVNTAQLASGGGLYTDTSGNVGIGTTSPGSKLHVYGASSPYVRIQDVAAFVNIGVDTASSNYIFYNSSNGHKFLINSGSSEAARIDTGGNFVMSNNGYIYFVDTTRFIRGGSSGQVIVGASSGGFYQQVGASYFTVTTSGGSTSDATLKKNVSPINNAVEKICSISGVTFEFVDEPMDDADKGEQLGVTAQDIEKQFPQIVITNADGKKSVRYDRLVAPLIEAVKELKAEVDQLRAQLEAK